MELVVVVVGGVVGALLLFAGLLLGGLRVVRRLGLNDPDSLPPGVHFSPPAPPLRAAGDAAGARAVAALQARRQALHNRARAIYNLHVQEIQATQGTQKQKPKQTAARAAYARLVEEKSNAAISCIDALTLDPDILQRGEASLSAIEQEIAKATAETNRSARLEAGVPAAGDAPATSAATEPAPPGPDAPSDSSRQ